MRFEATPLAGAWVVRSDRDEDDRGWFQRTFDAAAFAGHGLASRVAQANTSYNELKGTLRGMHLQDEPHAECKVVRCTRGAIFDVIIDLRPGSPTRNEWYGIELGERGGRALYVPEGVAHGFQTLADATEVTYLMSTDYVPESARGVRWDDPAFGIEWPLGDPTVISARDSAFPLV